MRQGSAAGDERAQKEGEAVFADLAEFSSLLSGSGDCSAAPFHCRLPNLLLYNEPVHFSKSHVQNAEGESIISVLAGVGWTIPLYTLPNQVLVDVFAAMNPWNRVDTLPVCYTNTVGVLEKYKVINQEVTAPNCENLPLD